MSPLERELALYLCAAEGLSQTEAARFLKMQVSGVCLYARRYAIKFTHGNSKRKLPPNKRAHMMAALYRDGYTLNQIGRQYNLTRERVRQIITKHFGIRAGDGGKHTLAVRSQTSRDAKRNDRYLVKHGCTFEQWNELKDVGAAMRRAGAGYYRTPLGAFQCQRNNARLRDIGWELTLWQWWTIWQQSGRWAERGRGQGYVMCRHGDVGPYAVGNVFIDKATANCSERAGKTSGLPIGVSGRRGSYRAARCINGELLRLGTYPTPELAHAAYLAAAA